MTVCREVEAVSFNYLRREWNILDPALAEDFKQLEKVEDAEFSVVSETADQRTWIVTFSKDDGPSASYIYSRSCNVLCCAVLCCAVLCCAVLCCAVLCYAVPLHAMLCAAIAQIIYTRMNCKLAVHVASQLIKICKSTASCSCQGHV